jgi:hypothetical protein
MTACFIHFDRYIHRIYTTLPSSTTNSPIIYNGMEYAKSPHSHREMSDENSGILVTILLRKQQGFEESYEKYF